MSDYNLFFSPYEHHKVGTVQDANLRNKAEGHNLPEWQKNSGYDMHSIQADPMFVDVKKGDFHLRAGSPAIGAGKDGVNVGALGVGK